MKNWYFWTVLLEKTLESPLNCKELKPIIPKGNQSWIFIGRTDAEAETPILWPLDAKNWLIGKDPDAGKDWRQEEKGRQRDEMVGWHHWLDGHEFEQALGVGDGQESLACCSPWGCKESDMTSVHSVQSLSRVWLFATPWTAALQTSLSITNTQSLLKLMSIESVMPSNHLSLYCPLLLLPSLLPSIRVFSNESVLRIRWPKYWSFSFSISPSNIIQDWFPLPLTGLISLQSKGFSRVFSNTTVQKHQFFSVQLSLWSNSHILTWLQEKS